MLISENELPPFNQSDLRIYIYKHCNSFYVDPFVCLCVSKHQQQSDENSESSSSEEEVEEVVRKKTVSPQNAASTCNVSSATDSTHASLQLGLRQKPHERSAVVSCLCCFVVVVVSLFRFFFFLLPRLKWKVNFFTISPRFLLFSFILKLEPSGSREPSFGSEFKAK